MAAGHIVDVKKLWSGRRQQMTCRIKFKSTANHWRTETGLSLVSLAMPLALQQEGYQYFAHIWQTMQACHHRSRGMDTEGAYCRARCAYRVVHQYAKMLISSVINSPMNVKH